MVLDPLKGLASHVVATQPGFDLIQSLKFATVVEMIDWVDVTSLIKLPNDSGPQQRAAWSVQNRLEVICRFVTNNTANWSEDPNLVESHVASTTRLRSLSQHFNDHVTPELQLVVISTIRRLASSFNKVRYGA